MIRDRVFRAQPRRDHGFRWRSREPSRLEGFSDAVFGFAITLLVLSVEVPKTVDQLAAMLSPVNIVAFAVSFATLVAIWLAQYHYFRRYGLDDGWTTTLNIVLLFVVLLYVYPLKFLFTELSRLAFGAATSVNSAQWPRLMALYSTGFVVVYVVFALLYTHAYRHREVLDLTAVEVVETRHSIAEQVGMIAIGSVSLGILALAVNTPFWSRGAGGLAGMAYVLIMPLQTVLGIRHGRALRALPSPA